MLSGNVQNSTILIVEDQLLNIRLLQGVLEHAGYDHVLACSDSRDAVEKFGQFRPDLVLLDLHMPHIDGFDVMSSIQDQSGEDYVPILVLTSDTCIQSKQRALARGAMDFLLKPYSATEVLLRVRNLLQVRQLHSQMKYQTQHLEQLVTERTSRLEEAQNEMLERLAQAAECRDDDTGEHTQRVGLMAALLAKKLGLPEKQVDLMRRSAPLHDVGKIAIPDSILLKDGKLSNLEFELMKAHTLAGTRLLQNGHSELVLMAEEIALNHHEKWDGTGYPRGLKGMSIPLTARIVSIVDVFDALTHERPYKCAWTFEQARTEILKQSGSHFDPNIVRAFVEVIDEQNALKSPLLGPFSTLQESSRRTSPCRDVARTAPGAPCADSQTLKPEMATVPETVENCFVEALMYRPFASDIPDGAHARDESASPTKKSASYLTLEDGARKTKPEPLLLNALVS